MVKFKYFILIVIFTYDNINFLFKMFIISIYNVIIAISFSVLVDAQIQLAKLGDQKFYKIDNVWEKPLKVRERGELPLRRGTSQGKGRQMKKCVRSWRKILLLNWEVPLKRKNFPVQMFWNTSYILFGDLQWTWE